MISPSTVITDAIRQALLPEGVRLLDIGGQTAFPKYLADGSIATIIYCCVIDENYKRGIGLEFALSCCPEKVKDAITNAAREIKSGGGKVFDLDGGEAPPAEGVTNA